MLARGRDDHDASNEDIINKKYKLVGILLETRHIRDNQWIFNEFFSNKNVMQYVVNTRPIILSQLKYRWVLL